MKLFTASQTRLLDTLAIDERGIPSLALMENAAAHTADAAMSLLRGPVSAAVFCGSGNNGGDGICAAVYLMGRGVETRVFLVGSRDRLTPDSAEMARRLEKAGGVLEDFSDSTDIFNYVNQCGVIIDAIFGFGLNAPVKGDALAAVEMINASPAPVVSADIPSGVEADTGRILGDAVDADVTVTFSVPKYGHFIEPGCVFCGRLTVADIGIPRSLIDGMESPVFSVECGAAALPARKRVSHKGDYGRCLIIAGSVGYTGAPCFSASAAVASGAGLVFLGVPRDIYEIAAVKCDEAMPFPLPCDREGKLSFQAEEAILSRLAGCDVCLAGPGLGRSGDVDRIICSIIRNSKVPLILDADGINAVAGNIDILDEKTCPLILTPHEGEFARLGGFPSGDRLAAAREFAVKHDCILVLKGHRTISAFPDGTAYLNTTGNPGMARGGSGDVLAGMIASFAGQNFPLKDAVIRAVYLHGLAGDICAEKYGEYYMTPSALIRELPNTRPSAGRATSSQYF